MKKVLVVLCLCVVFGMVQGAQAGEIKLNGTYDMQYRFGDSYVGQGRDNFKVMDLYLYFKSELAENVKGQVMIDGADLTKDTTDASHKYLEEANITFSNVADLPLTIVFGKDEMPYGQDYDKGLIDPLAHLLEIDKVWGINFSYKVMDKCTVQAGMWEQNTTSDLSIYNNLTGRIKLELIDDLKMEFSIASLGNDSGAAEFRVNGGLVYKIKDLAVYGEFDLFNNNFSDINGETMGDAPVLLTVGAEYFISPKWKLKGRYEYVKDDLGANTLAGAYDIGVDYWFGEKVAIMAEFYTVIGDGAAADVNNIMIGVKGKY